MKEEKIDKNLIGAMKDVEPSHGFSDRVMSRVYSLEQAPYSVKHKPVVSLQLLIVLVSLLACIIAPLVFADRDSGNTSVFTNAIHHLESFYSLFNSPLFTLGVLSMFFLLLFEKLLAKAH